jgi:hypothetical protein
MTYKNGRWGSAGGIGVMMYHDYTNDLPAAAEDGSSGARL